MAKWTRNFRRDLKRRAYPLPMFLSVRGARQAAGSDRDEFRRLLHLKPAAWSPNAGELSGTVRAEWILKGRYQQVSSRTGEYETRELQRYEPRSGKYHKWVFSSDGSNSFRFGAWNDESSTMTWEYVDFGAGLRGTIVDRFFSDGKYESKLLMEDGTDNVLLDVRSIQTPVQ